MEKPPPRPMSREEFRRWLAGQTGERRYERVAGEPVAMAPERVAHARLKARMWRALDDALRAAGADCEALPDGVTVEIGEDTDYEPDAVVDCGDRLPGDAVAATNPVIVVEVLSPGTRGVDTGAKLTDYFRVPSIRHYLIVRTDRKSVVHYRRAEGGGVSAQFHQGGVLDLDPPGIRLDLDAVYGA
ncbi:Uma2 family endonuclease [Azospirillum sp. SYSU D00513]|uniref:Uma2 family endonuclease n=1 Tax=Azospirillum sp. SYSU D00513 TaxID=2812561 RepID=UPI001A96C448|nr:Uma2 family endonuclease [Azospirillum sp. SYSU D00513]